MRSMFFAIAGIALLCGCGGSSSGGTERDEADVRFEPPMLLSSVLETVRRRHVQPTELAMELALLGETTSSHVVIEEGISDEPGVRSVLLESEILELVPRQE